MQYIKQVAETCDDEDRSESLEVASQCLPEGFGIDTEDAKYKVRSSPRPPAVAYAVTLVVEQLPRTLLEIFEIGLRACQQQSISHQERLKSDSKYSKFIKTLTGAGFFNGVVEGSAGTYLCSLLRCNAAVQITRLGWPKPTRPMWPSMVTGLQQTAQRQKLHLHLPQE